MQNESAVKALLQRYPKAVAHMWRQRNDERLGLVFGAGASMPIGIPSWQNLLDRIAEHREVNGTGLLGTSNTDPLPTAAQVLFQHFRNSQLNEVSKEVGGANLIEKIIQARWKRIVHACLYKDAPTTPGELAAKDKVYKYYLDIVKTAPLTVNYNFDDTIERLLGHYRTLELGARPAGDISQPAASRAFDAVVDSRLVFRKNTGNILHVNGYLPYNLLEGIEGPLVLNEISFEDQLIDSIGGAFATLLHYFTKHTFLFIGLSLQDETLRHLLRQNAILNPGHHHYRIYYVDDASKIPADTIALTDSHFETYNMITLFLDSDGIAALGEALSSSSSELLDVSRNIGQELFFTYYLAGVPGAGKTTTFRHLASLVAHDEWVEERIELMSKPWPDLTAAERDQIDTWIERQVRLNNQNILAQKRGIGIGINIIDRCPPDAIAFGEGSGWAAKAIRLLDAISNGAEKAKLAEGEVLLLAGDPHELLYRAKARDRQLNAKVDFIEWLQEATCIVYAGRRGEVTGIRTIDTRGLSVRQVVKLVSRVIFLDKYSPADLDRRLRAFAAGRLQPIKRKAPRSR